MRFRTTWWMPLFALAFTASALAQPSVPPPGDGLTTATAYRIAELGHLVWMGNTVAASSGKYYRLMNDINALDSAKWNDRGTTTGLVGFRLIGTRSVPFLGIFDGGGHKIAGLTINRPDTECVGLFGQIGPGSKVTALGLEGGEITGSSCTGALAGLSNLGTVTNCYATAAVTGGRLAIAVGGLVGNNGGTIANCHATGAVTGRDGVGGLVGQNWTATETDCTGTVANCYATGSVTSRGNGGGLTGDNDGPITNCYATGTVMGLGCVGGLTGYNLGPIATCYATGAVTGSGADSGAGGLVGHNAGELTNCYATGAVTGSYSAGGLAGVNPGGVITDCYAAGWVTGPHATGGLTGQNWGMIADAYWDAQTTGQSVSDGGTSETTAQMKEQATFANWDFGAVWAIAEGASYPYLRFSPPPFHLAITVIGHGTVTPDGGDYAPGERVTLLAIPEGPNTRFVGWTGAVEDRLATATSIAMNSHKSVTAHFRTGYRIRTQAELRAIATGDLDGQYVLMNDLDASDRATRNDSGSDGDDKGTGFVPIGTESVPFTGVFDGGGHRITGLRLNRPRLDGVGLFGAIGPSGVVSNLGIEGGSLAGGDDVGGLAGENLGTITNCYVTAMVKGKHNVGELAGENYGSVVDCHAAGTVTGHGSAIGGLAGHNDGAVGDSYASASVTSIAGYWVGGLAGENDGAITDCFATGAVLGTGHAFGGLVGAGYLGTVTGSYWDTGSTGQATSAGGTGRTTAQMKQEATFQPGGAAGPDDWDFTNVWAISPTLNSGYPHLRTFPSVSSSIAQRISSTHTEIWDHEAQGVLSQDSYSFSATAQLPVLFSPAGIDSGTTVTIQVGSFRFEDSLGHATKKDLHAPGRGGSATFTVKADASGQSRTVQIVKVSWTRKGVLKVAVTARPPVCFGSVVDNILNLEAANDGKVSAPVQTYIGFGPVLGQYATVMCSGKKRTRTPPGTTTRLESWSVSGKY